MRNYIERLGLVLLLLLPCACGRSKVYPKRWVFVMRQLRTDTDVEAVERIARTAAEHGLNGLVLAAGLDELELQPPEYIERIRKVKEICDRHQLELVPQIFSAGYGGSVLDFNPNLAEGLRVENALFVVKGSQARLEPDPAARFLNGGFEEGTKGFQVLDPQAASVDSAVSHSGKASLRFAGFTGNARVGQEIAVEPHRLYRVTCWVKTESLEPPERFRVQVLGSEGRALIPRNFHLAASGDWRRLTLGFNSLSSRSVRVLAGVWGANGGKFWLDDFAIQEIGPVNVVRRPGTPVTVRGEKSGLTYEEGRDYGEVRDPQLNFRFDHDAPAIGIPAGSRIREGDRLRVSFYHGIAIHDSQVTVCMSEPALYAIWREQARRLHHLLAPRTYLLSMDEIRAGGSDLACQNRKMSMAEILGDCFRKQVEMLRELNPKAEIFTWSDMLDPNHNARGNYYLVEGDYTGSWKYAPRELQIMCWYYERRVKSLAFFSGLGFKTMAGAYYDADTLENPRGWLEALDRTPGALGIMYTTWRNKFELLGAFGDLVSREGR